MTKTRQSTALVLLDYAYRFFDELISRQGALIILGVGVLLTNLPADNKTFVLSTLAGGSGAVAVADTNRRRYQGSSARTEGAVVDAQSPGSVDGGTQTPSYLDDYL